MENNQCCGNCRYWKTVFDYKQGICHRKPPNPDGYPSTTAGESCGEFRCIVWIPTKKGIGEDLTRIKDPSTG
jgi:hypothetical protein